MTKTLSLILAGVTGLLFVVIGHLLVGVLAAIPIPAHYWESLREYPGLYTSLYTSAMGSVLIVFFTALSAAFVRWLPRVTPLHVMACALSILAWGAVDLAATMYLTWPAMRTSNVFIILSIVVSVAAMPFAIWLGGRLAGARAPHPAF